MTISRKRQPLKTSFDVVVKIAERCNLACDYCYYYFQEFNNTSSPAFITPAVVEELPHFLARSIDQLQIDTLGIGLHGGEPLLLKKTTFDGLCTDIRRALDGRVPFRLAMQTNGTLIDEEWIELFSKHHVRVGVSIDGPRYLHDRRRLDHAGRGSYDNAVRGLKLLQAAKREGRIESAGLLGVIYEDGGDEAIRHFVQDLHVDSPNLNFPRGGWDNADAVRWGQSVASHRKMVTYALSSLTYPKFHPIRGISEVLLALQSDTGARLNDGFSAQRHNIATISSEGVIYPDDNLLAVDDAFSSSNLTIFGTSLKDFILSDVWQRLQSAIREVPDECSDCEWYRSCRSGHLFNRYSRERSFARKSTLCDTLKMIHEEVAQYLIRNRATTVQQMADRLSEAPAVTCDDVFEQMMSKSVHGCVSPVSGTE